MGGNDKSTPHATRGKDEDFKTHYIPEFPTVTIIHAVPGGVMTPERLEEMGCIPSRGR